MPMRFGPSSTSIASSPPTTSPSAPFGTASSIGRPATARTRKRVVDLLNAFSLSTQLSGSSGATSSTSGSTIIFANGWIRLSVRTSHCGPRGDSAGRPVPLPDYRQEREGEHPPQRRRRWRDLALRVRTGETPGNSFCVHYKRNRAGALVIALIVDDAF